MLRASNNAYYHATMIHTPTNTHVDYEHHKIKTTDQALLANNTVHFHTRLCTGVNKILPLRITMTVDLQLRGKPIRASFQMVNTFPNCYFAITATVHNRAHLGNNF